MGNQTRNDLLLVGLIADVFLVAVMATATMSMKVFAQGQITLNGAGATFPFSPN